MIIDILENSDCYVDLHEGFARAFSFLRRQDLLDLPVGNYAIDAESIFAIVAKDPGRRKEDAELETHQKYIDIQFILAGTDDMGWRPKQLCQHPAGAYDREGDIQYFTDQPHDSVTVGPGMFAIFFPQDAHQPLIADGMIHKVVVKVAV